MRQLHIEYLRTLLSVAQLRSFSKAAAELHMSQANVSQQIKALEDHFQVLLLHRDRSTGIQLTEVGEGIIRNIRDCVSSFEHAEALTAKHVLRIATSITLGSLIAPKLLELGHICVTMGNSGSVYRMLTSGEVDIGIAADLPSSKELRKIPLFSEEVRFIVNKRHDLADREQVSIQAFSHYPMIVREQGSATRVSVEAVLKAKGIVANCLVEVGTNEGIVSVIKRNDRLVGYLPAIALHVDPSISEVRFRGLRVSIPICMICGKYSNHVKKHIEPLVEKIKASRYEHPEYRRSVGSG